MSGEYAMKRPLIWILFFYSMGVVTGQWIGQKTSIVLFFIVILLFSSFLMKIYKWNVLLLMPIFFLVGVIRIGQSESLKDPHLHDLLIKNNSLSIHGKVQDINYSENGGVKAIIAVKESRVEDTVFLKPIKVQAFFPEGTILCYHQEVILDGQVGFIQPPRNPGGFNEKRYYKARNIEYKFFVKNINSLTYKKNFLTHIYIFREKMKYIYYQLLPQKEASVLNAMILGDRTGLDEEIEQLYQKSGVSHMIAISGLHFSIIGIMIMGLQKMLKVPLRIRSGVTIVLLLLYCLFIGYKVSAVRAGCMLGIILLGFIIYREPDVYTSIAFSALLLVVYQPLYIWEAGFQLSYGAVLGLLFITPLLHRLYIIPIPIRTYVFPAIAASLATYPIVAYHFYFISIIGIIVNILILPFVSLIILFGFAGGILYFISPALSQFTVGIVYAILVAYEKVCLAAVKLPYSTIVIGRPPIWMILLYYSLCAVVVLYYYCPIQKRQFYRKLKNSIWIIAVLIVVIYQCIPKKLDIIFLDVGQGDAIMIHTPFDQHILIDGGGNIRKPVGEKNTGFYVILPYLKYKGITKLDTIFLTHPDADHILGLIEVLGSIHVDQIIVPDQNYDQCELYRVFKEKAQDYHIPINYMSTGCFIQYHDDIKMDCLYPSSDPIPLETGWNNTSLVLHMRYKDHRFLFTGDIEKAGEECLTSSYPSIPADILKAPHHGSNTSSTTELLQSVSPSGAVISCGEKNAYGHPHADVLKRYSEHGIPIYCTAYNGAVMVHSDGKVIHLKTMIPLKGQIP